MRLHFTTQFAPSRSLEQVVGEGALQPQPTSAPAVALANDILGTTFHSSLRACLG